MLLKLLLVAAAAIAAWLLFRYLQRAVGRRQVPRKVQKAAIADLRPCRICGTYVEPHAAPCERGDCPLPKVN